MSEYLAMDNPQIKQDLGNEYLTFRLGEEDYGVDILRVQEIRGWEVVTRIPNAPDYVKGVLNLRGSIVPIFDMRQRLGMPASRYSKDTVVIVVQVKGAQSEQDIGVVVDAVSDVLTAKQDSIRNTPDFGVGAATEFITGLVDVSGTSVQGGDAQMPRAHGAQERAVAGQERAEANADSKMIMLLDVDKLLNRKDRDEHVDDEVAA